jgi:hypothetical protein
VFFTLQEAPQILHWVNAEALFKWTFIGYEAWRLPIFECGIVFATMASFVCRGQSIDVIMFVFCLTNQNSLFFRSGRQPSGCAVIESSTSVLELRFGSSNREALDDKSASIEES